MIKKEILLVVLLIWIKSSFSFFLSNNNISLRKMDHTMTTGGTLDGNDGVQATMTTESSVLGGFRLNLGFIGCGTIASAMVVGFAKQSKIPIHSIIVSKRSESKSSLLQQQFPDLVIIEDDNQNIVNRADIVFLTVLPKQASQVVQGLQFQPDKHVLVSLVSTSKIDSLVIDSKLPIEQVYKMICLPAVAYAEGVCLLQPKPRIIDAAGQSPATTTMQILEPLFETLGGVIIAENDDEMAAMMVPSSLMGSFYGILQNNYSWLVTQHNIAPEKASFLISRMYHSMIQDVIRKSSSSDDQNDKNNNLFRELIAEQTPGGLNEQVLKNLNTLGVMDAYDVAQTAVVQRIQGKSDGSLPPN